MLQHDTQFNVRMKYREMSRFNTDNAYVWNYGDIFLVVCPGCQQCARVITMVKNDKPEVRLSCINCGYSKDWIRESAGILYCQKVDYFKQGEVSIGAAVDWYFHEPLWLQEQCCGETLWAYNHAHLRWLKSFVSAALRERSPHEDHGWSNQSLASRLPKWIKLASNRKAILTAIEKIELKITQTKNR